MCVRVPGCRCVLNCWSDVADVGCSSDLVIRRRGVTTENSTGSTSLFGGSTNVVIEIQLCINAKTQVFRSGNSVESLAVYSVGTL